MKINENKSLAQAARADTEMQYYIYRNTNGKEVHQHTQVPRPYIAHNASFLKKKNLDIITSWFLRRSSNLTIHYELLLYDQILQFTSTTCGISYKKS